MQRWSRGKSCRLTAKGWFQSPLEQFVFKTRAVNAILGNRNMIGKIPTWWENSDRGNRKNGEKIPLWWEISLSRRKKVFLCMNHLILRHPSYMRGTTYPFSLSVYAVLLYRANVKYCLRSYTVRCIF
jgi:hypothetical protein